jgi:hypothetical protein
MQSLASWLTYRFDGFVDSPDWGDRTLIERAGHRAVYLIPCSFRGIRCIR